MASYPFNPDPTPPIPPFEAALFYITWFGGFLLIAYFIFWLLPFLIRNEKGGQESA
jgi:hypothetical protein